MLNGHVAGRAFLLLPFYVVAEGATDCRDDDAFTRQFNGSWGDSVLWGVGLPRVFFPRLLSAKAMLPSGLGAIQTPCSHKMST